MLSDITLSVIYAECRIFVRLSDIIMSGIMLSVIYVECRIFVVMPSDINLNDIMLGVLFCYAEFTLIVVMLSVASLLLCWLSR